MFLSHIAHCVTRLCLSLFASGCACVCLFESQARDRWNNNLWGPFFNVTAELFLASDGMLDSTTNTTTNTTVGSNHTVISVESSSVTFLGNGSGIALVTYIPLEAGVSSLHGEGRVKGDQAGAYQLSRAQV